MSTITQAVIRAGMEAEILRLRAQVAALLKVKEAAEQCRGAPMPLALMLIDKAITAYTSWEIANAKP